MRWPYNRPRARKRARERIRARRSSLPGHGGASRGRGDRPESDTLLQLICLNSSSTKSGTKKKAGKPLQNYIQSDVSPNKGDKNGITNIFNQRQQSRSL